MLDIMRKKKRMQAIVLWVVIIAVGGSMLVWGVALNLGGNSGRSALGSSAAVVDGRAISMKEFLETYTQSIKSLQDSAQTELDPELLKSLGMSQQVLDRLIRGKIVEILAERLGVSVTKNEVRQAIMTHPSLQVDGKFIGLERYKQLLAMNGFRIESFEEDMWYAELATKLTRTITDSLEISDQELREEFSRVNQTTRVDYTLLNKDSFNKRVQPTDTELQAYFEENKARYTIKEKRRAQYLLVSTSSILPDIQVSEEEIKQEWDKNPLPEMVEAAHILFLVKDPAEEEAVRSKAESVLKQIQDGADFAAMARKYSEDTSNAEQGGYLRPFQRGQMVKEFEDAAFSMKPGELSGLVRTRDYGFHIIKLLQRDVPTMESNRSNLYATVQRQKAKDAAKAEAQKGAKLAAEGKTLDSIGAELGITTEIKETGLFSKDDNPYSLGMSQALHDDIFQIKEIGSFGNVVEHTLGYAFAKLEEVQMPRPGQFQESLDQVKQDFINSKARELMEAEARKLSEEAVKESLASAAKKLGHSVQTSPDFKIDESPGPDIVDQNAFNSVAFKLEQDSVSNPISMSDTTAVLQVKSRSPFDEACI